MKSLKLSLLACVVTTGLALLSCNSDPCEKVTCKNSGVATASSDNKSCACKCTAGYEGTDCSTKSKTKFIKTWSATDNPGSLIYSPIISDVSDTTKVTDVLVAKLSDGFFVNNITATVDQNTITIPEQKPDPNGNYKVRGSGTISNGIITMSYKLLKISPVDSLSYSGTWK